jgi:hypothetical protein
LLLVFCDEEFVEFDTDEFVFIVPLFVNVADEDEDDNSSDK